MSSPCERTLAALALGTTLSGVTLPALAGHDDPDHPQITDQSAYTVPEGMHKVGLLSVEYGIVDRFQFGVSTLAWSLFAPNAFFEWRFLDRGPVALSAAVGGTYVSTRPYTLIWPELPIADMAIVPLELIGSFRVHDDWTLSVGGQFTGLALQGEYNEADFEGVAAVSNLQSHATVEWRLSRLVALLIHGRYLVFQTARAGATVTTQPDEFTTIVASAAGDTDALNFPHAFQLVPAIQLSWEAFNLRLGLGYGNYIIPAINMVLPKRGPVPQVDLYWRF